MDEQGLGTQTDDIVCSRMQCEMVEGGSRGNRLIGETFRKMWKNGGISTFYRGLPLGLIGVFPYRCYFPTTALHRNMADALEILAPSIWEHLSG